MKKTALIIHGTEGSPDGNWFPWLKRELDARGWEVAAPRFPTPEGQSLANWLSAFDSIASAIGATSVLIGHSLGAAFALRLIEERSVQPIAACLVAGFLRPLGNLHYDALNFSFIAQPFDWKIIRARTGKFFCFSGDNDPYVPLQLGLELAEKLGTAPVVMKGGGHLNAEFGYDKFEKLLQDILSLERWDGK